MRFNPQERERILRRVTERLPNLGTCVACRSNQWTLAEGFVAFPLQDSTGTFTLGGPTMPCIAVVCNVCGNTLFLNAIVLGLTELLADKAVV